MYACMSMYMSMCVESSHEETKNSARSLGHKIELETSRFL